MQNELNLPPGELLRLAMRHWVTGVAIVTSYYETVSHGMTVNSFISISLDPPLVAVTMNNNTRTLDLVEQSGVFAVTILSAAQQDLAELFAGRLVEPHDRMKGLSSFTMVTGAPLLMGGLAFIDCQVVHRHPMPHCTMYIGEVVDALISEDQSEPPLVYVDRAFSRLA